MKPDANLSDPAAFERAYDQHARGVYRAAYRVLGSAAQAQDVVQDVFLKLWREPGKFDARRGELGSYLGEALCLQHAARWDRREDPELGPFAYQASAVLLPQGEAQPPLRLNVYSVALRALQDPTELDRFVRELQGLPAAPPA